jgi:hypothetical protein
MTDGAVTVVNPETNKEVLPFIAGEKPPEVPKQPELTRKQIGELRRRYFTKEYSRVLKCGHKFDPNSIPRTHCDACWEVYFRSIDLVEIHNALQASVQAVVTQYGEVFVKQFRRFVQHSLATGGNDVPTSSPTDIQPKAV